MEVLTGSAGIQLHNSAGVRTGIQTGIQIGIQTGSQTGIQTGNQSFFLPEGIQSCDLISEFKTRIQTGIQAGIQTGTTFIHTGIQNSRIENTYTIGN